MYKIRKVKFENHPILKDLELDFCDSNGKAVDTVIIAGENGCGKSTILDSIYATVNNPFFDITVEFETNEKVYTMICTHDNTYGLRTKVIDSNGQSVSRSNFKMLGIFSDVNINFYSQPLQSVTSMNIDTAANSRRSENDFPTKIKQLLIDIQALDDAALASAYRTATANGESTEDLVENERMSRFTRAFDYMFDDLSYSHISNRGNHKEVVFQKNGIDVPIDSLSSGEKQIVYRGCFLLKDVNAINGAFVFIDEPEISLHPKWQTKIMDFYKRIFTDESGVQTSQIFAVTHSPFIIHNDNRKNDKVIVLARDENGNIIVKDKPEYYMCNSIEAVQDAFSVSNFSAEQPTVYLEGRTDEMYFNKALEVFGLEVPFKFQWVGHLNNSNNEEFSGSGNLNKAYQFLLGCNSPVKNVCLFDCDTNRQEIDQNNVYTMVIPPYQNSKNMKKGIENALVLDSINVTPYYITKEKEGDYGDKTTITEFQKMNFCTYICSLDKTTLQAVFLNLKTEIDRINALFQE